MSIGLISTGAPSAGPAATSTASALGKADTSRTERSSGKTGDETLLGNDSRSRSFGELIAKREADPSARQDARPEIEFAAPREKTKGHAPWRPFDLMKPQRAVDREEEGTPAESSEEMEPGTDATIAFVVPAQTVATAKEGPGTASAEGRQEPPPAAFGATGIDGDANRAKDSSRRQGSTASPDNRTTPVQGANASPAAGAEPEAAEARPAGRGEPMLAEQARAVRAAPGASAAAAERGEPRVTVVSAHVAPAPAMPAGLSLTGAAFVDAMSSDGALPQHQAAARALPEGLQSSPSKPVTTLKLQLHPAELGAVTVKLTGSGEQLAIEVQVDNAEARHRLSTDSESILKALRGIGYDIDRITIQQAPSSNAAQGGGANREGGFAANEGRSGERQEQSARQESGQRHDQNARGNTAGMGDRSEVPGGGVYI